MKIDAAEIKKILQERKVVFGTESSLRHLKKGKLESVLITSNGSKETKKILDKFCALSKMEVVIIPFNSQELGMLCKKSFPISVLGVLKS
ncbi:ribosomal L7Ae/L30e/S12e/Gadd45 family protein [Candidatus Woesearchaeota archaeon]|nr:ribosomal L7Ae/L30e/S12e/Gadd45 family protein [Candidatus Woesearchaeota archaeon]